MQKFLLVWIVATVQWWLFIYFEFIARFGWVAEDALSHVINVSVLSVPPTVLLLVGVAVRRVYHHWQRRGVRPVVICTGNSIG